jgi:aminopeptidase N
MGGRAFADPQRRWVAENSGTSRSTDDFIDLASDVAGRDPRPLLESWPFSTRTPPMPGHPDWAVTRVP